MPLFELVDVPSTLAMKPLLDVVDVTSAALS